MHKSTAVIGVIAGLVGSGSIASASHTSPGQHQAPQASPILLGVSGSSQEHIVSGPFYYCYAGTLGALINVGSDVAVLSNNHVLAKENEPDNGLSVDGNVIIHPGLLDRDPCPSVTTNLDPEQVAFGVTFIPLAFCKGRRCPTNHVDAAHAKAGTDKFAADGEILGVGVLDPTVVNVDGSEPARLVVQKSGRTTGHTKGTVEAVAISLNVSYNSGTAWFEDQIRIRGCGTTFSAPGDSGSLVATLPDGGSPQPVGLLFAGGGEDTFANPAGRVLTALGSSGFVGNGGTAGTLQAGNDHPECVEQTSGGGGGGGGGKGKKPRSANPTSVGAAAAIKARNSDRLMGLPEVIGHGIGFDQDGRPLIELYLRSARPAGSFPSNVEGIPVKLVVTGPVRAY